MKIIFMGTPDFAVPALQQLIKSSHEIIAVYTRAPKPKGRGMAFQKSPIHSLAEDNGLPVFTPKSLKKSEEDQEIFIKHQADIAVVAAYGLLLPKAVLEAPKYGCLNIHASLLPRWRGASPIQHAIWKGDTVSGVTIMQMEEGLDTGPMIMKGDVPITNVTTAQDLHDDLSVIGGTLIIKTLASIHENKKISATVQNDKDATYAPLLKKEDGKISSAKPIADIDCQIRALNPWPGTYIQGHKGRVKILKAHIEEGQLIYDKVQPEGKKPMDMRSAINGGYL